MKKVKIFLGVACMTVAVAAVSATKLSANFTAPEYYLATDNSCQEIPETGCITTGTTQCTVDFAFPNIARPVFDDAACQTKLFVKP